MGCFPHKHRYSNLVVFLILPNYPRVKLLVGMCARASNGLFSINYSYFNISSRLLPIVVISTSSLKILILATTFL